jgi:hypothetical protein
MEQRFIVKIDKTSSANGCWLWTASLNHGYGQFHNKNGPRIASRIAYELWVGKITNELHVRHKCDEPSCCNPEHLELGTHQDNMNDMIERGRKNVAKGERHACAKLTDDDIREIRILFGFGFGHRELGRRFSIDHKAIGAILKRKTWKHVK